MSANLHKALALYNQGLFEDAAIALSSSLKQKPINHNAFNLAAMIYNKMGKYSEASGYADVALIADTYNHEIWNTKGNIEANIGNQDAAISAFKKSLSLNPNYTSAQQNLAFLFNKLQAPLDAIPLFETLTQKVPNKTAYIIGRARALIMAERSAEAITYLESAEATLPPDLALYTKAQALFAAGDYTLSLENYNSIPPSSNLYSQALRNSFQILHLTGQEHTLNKLLDTQTKHSKPDDIASLYVQTIEKLHGPDAATTYASTQFSEHQSSPFMLSALAKLDIDNKAYADGFKKTAQALELIPGHPSFLTQHVTTAIGLGNYDYAKGIISHQMKTMPNDQYWLAMYATLQRLMGENYKYLYDYNQFIKSYELPIPKNHNSQGSYLTSLKSALLKLHEYETAPLDQSLRNGSQTRSNLVHLDIPEIRSFFTSIELCIHEYVQGLPNDLKHPFLRRKTENPRVISAWSVKLTGTGFHVNHVHPEGWISSAFYVDVPDGTEKDPDKKGWIKFGQPSFDIPGLDAEHFIAPAPGKLVLFPSYMWHGTIPTADKTLRLTLPFDVLPV